MPQPTPYERLYDFGDYQIVNPTKPLRGTEVDAELDAIKLTTDQIRANSALIQRDDGKLSNQSVTPESLSAGALAMIHQGEYTPRGAWDDAVDYELGDVVDFNAATYLCIVAHTSTVSFAADNAAGRWLLIANGALQGGGQAVDLFEGNGTQTVYSLSFTYNGNNAATVFVAGVAQIPGQDFTIVGDTLTFVVAPPAPSVAGRDNVMVRGTGVEAQLAADAATTAAANAEGFANSAQASATAAAASETAAADSASAASTSATSASTSASTATTQATTATNAATAAAASESAAATSETNAASSATSAATSATTATTQATNAATSASSASTSATTATTQASNAATSATNAADSASAAAASETNAAASAASAAASLDNFDDRYLGPKASDPTVDNDGDPLLAGALYYRSTAPVGMKVYDGAQWIEASSAQQAALVTFEYVATAGQTTFTGADANGVALSYIAGGVVVALNGVVLRPGDDYTASTGTSIVLASGALVGDELMVFAFSSFVVANTYTQAQVDAFAVKLTGNQTVAGVKTFSSDPVMGVSALTGDIAAARITNALNATGSAPIYACRAWANFNGTGTVAIRASGNVSSITDNGTGAYTVNFTTALPDTDYLAVASTQGLAAGAGSGPVQVFSGVSGGSFVLVPPTTTTCAVATLNFAGAFADNPSVNISIFR